MSKKVRWITETAVMLALLVTLQALTKPQAPVMPLLIVSEPSSEAIQRQLIIGEPSIGLVNDEGGQFLGGFAMSPEKRLSTLTTLSRLWDRGEFDRVRVGDGSGSYYGRRLCLHLMVQPAVAASLLADPLAREQGFLFIDLLEEMTRRGLDEKSLFFVCDNHWSPEGNRAAAEILEPYVRQALAVRP